VGEQIVRQARHVLAQASIIQEIADSDKDSLGSPLRLGAIFTIGPYLFPQLLPELHRVAPDMPLVLQESYTASLREKLVNTSLDAILIALPFNEPDVVTKKLYDEPFVVLLPKDHPWAERSSIDPVDMASEVVLLLGEATASANRCSRPAPAWPRGCSSPTIRRRLRPTPRSTR
jgi:LysR family hydrogen peroxide-inducible transcriptional activator